MEKKRCIFCMQELKEGQKKCPSCGRGIWEYQWEETLLRPYTVLDERYLVGRVLGRGAFGITYLAWDTEDEKRIAVKEYFPQAGAVRDRETQCVRAWAEGESERFENSVEKFLREGTFFAEVGEIPGLVHCTDCFGEHGTGYLVMEYLEGGSLKEYIKSRHTVEAEEAFQMLLPAAKALMWLHSEGIVHCDVSPDNLLFDGSGKVKLIDLGAAKRQGMNPEEKEVKEAYAPAEQYQEKEKTGPWSDLYAFCAVWYEMTTGRKVPPALNRLKQDVLKAPSEYVKISSKLEEAMMQGLSLEIQRRFFCMENLLARAGKTDVLAELPGMDNRGHSRENAVETERILQKEKQQALSEAVRARFGGLWIEITTEVERSLAASDKGQRIGRRLKKAGLFLLGFVMAAGLSGGGVYLYCRMNPGKALDWKIKKERQEAQKTLPMIEKRDSKEYREAAAFLEERAYEVEDYEFAVSYDILPEAMEGWVYPRCPADEFAIKRETMKRQMEEFLGKELTEYRQGYHTSYAMVYDREAYPITVEFQEEDIYSYEDGEVYITYDCVTDRVTEVNLTGADQVLNEEMAERFFTEILPVVCPETYLTPVEIEELWSYWEREELASITLNEMCGVSITGWEDMVSLGITAR